MEYKHGVRLTPLTHEMTPLEFAIEQYSKKAKAHYGSQKHPQNLKNKEALDKALKHLEHERRLAEVIVDVQSDLSDYREYGRKLVSGSRSEAKTGLNIMSSEKHHPTAVLEKFLRADGRPKPSQQHTAHHIVPGKGKTKYANRARLHIHSLSVRINDPDNGTWLVSYKKDTPHWAMPKSAGHLQYHTHNYERWVYESLTPQISEGQVRHRLRLLGRMLQEGNQPKEVRMPPDPNWNGK